MATKTLNTRIALKTDTTANWGSSSLVLLKGEAALEILESGNFKIKIGDGVKTFKELPYATMTPEEINALITDGSVQSVSLASGTNNGTLKLTVDGKATDNIAVKGLGSAAYTNTNAYATAAQGTLATNAVRKVATGSGNGTISVTTGTGAATDVAVKGLGSAAYTASNAYATAAQGTKADNAMPKTGGTFTGAVTLDADPTANLQPATKQYVDSKISSSIAASDAMVFKGTIGSNGTSTTLPTSAVIGDTYKVITQLSVPADNSYTASAETAKVGDLVVAMTKDPKWLVVPSGDEIVTTVKYSTTTSDLTTSAKSGSITLGEAAIKQIDSTITSGSTSTKLPTSKAVVDYVTWGNVQGKPSTFTPSTHTHTKDQVGLGNVDNTADKDKSVKYATSAGTATNVSGTAADTTVDAARHIWFSNNTTETKRDYNDALKYNPQSNTITANITGSAASANAVAWDKVTGKPSTFTPSTHTHAIADVTGLQTALDGKAASGHTHTEFTKETHFSNGTYADPATGISCAVKVSGNLAATTLYEGATSLANKYQAKGSYAAASHTHTIAQITDLQTKLNGKSDTGHTHDDRYYTETEMDTKLAGKANASHGHASFNSWGENTIKTIADDTVANWANKNNSVHYYNAEGELNGQPSRYGFLFNMAYGSSEIHQIWAEHGGSLNHRHGNAAGIDKTWRTLLDSANYTAYTVTKTGTGASGTWGISITGNAATASSCTGNAATATVADSAKVCTGNAATATKLAAARKIGNASFDGSGDITLTGMGAAAANHTHNYAGSSSVGGAANSAVKLSTARAFSITGGVTAAAVNFDGSGNVTLNATVASVSTDVLFNGSNTLVLDCGGAV